jgi:catechol 2,3-dioxygenase-like lactoylglutathione lyase family enzyme
LVRRVRLPSLIEDTTITTPLRMHHIRFNTASVADTQVWYAKHVRGDSRETRFDAADLPGVNLTFVKADAAVAGTKGRVLDHIGFEVKNLEAFCEKLEASGLKLDRPYTRLPNSTTAIAFLTDPWGTYIELTENLAPSAAAKSGANEND